MPLAIELKSITKRFGSFVANENVSLGVERGTVHAIVGENGAGKTTLMNVLFGLLQPDEGEIWIEGERRTLRNPAVAISAGVGMVHQHFKLVASMSVAENLFLNRQPLRFGLLTDQKLRRGTHRSIQSLEKDIRDWIKNWNEDPKPFAWNKTADEILERLNSYLQRIPGAGH